MPAHAVFPLAAICVLAAILPGPCQARMLTAAERAQFEREYVPACLQLSNKKADVLSFGGTERDYEIYCQCAASSFSRMDHSGERMPTDKQNQAVYDKCIRMIFKKSPSLLLEEQLAKAHEEEVIKLMGIENVNTRAALAFKAYAKCTGKEVAKLVMHSNSSDLKRLSEIAADRCAHLLDRIWPSRSKH